MLLIRCPYCEMERPEVEFKYGGQAHLKREPQTATDEEWTDFLYFRDNPKGVHAERWRHAVGLRAVLQLPARHGERQDSRHLQGRRAAAVVALSLACSRRRRAQEVRQIAPDMFAPMYRDPNAPAHKLPPPPPPQRLRLSPCRRPPTAEKPPPPPPPPVVAPSRG